MAKTSSTIDNTNIQVDNTDEIEIVIEDDNALEVANDGIDKSKKEKESNIAVKSKESKESKESGSSGKESDPSTKKKVTKETKVSDSTKADKKKESHKRVAKDLATSVMVREGEDVDQVRELMSRLTNVTQEDVERLLRLSDEAENFQILMMEFDCALSEVRTKLEVLNKELALRSGRNPFESIKSRIKTPVSIYEKLKKHDIEFSVAAIEENLSDVAGIRVICSFVDDIFMLAECLEQQDDIRVIQRKDYIANPKPSGYRSLHLILEVPIFLTTEKKYMKVEVQFRTIAMDFWASLEHKMKYKKNIEDAETISDDLRFSADLINQLDRRMQQIRERIDKGHEKQESEKKKTLDLAEQILDRTDKSQTGWRKRDADM